MLYLYDSENRLISRARHQPLVIGAEMPPSAATSFEIKRDRISIIYEIKASASRLTVNWSFQTDFIWLEPFLLDYPTANDIVQIIYFPEMVAYVAEVAVDTGGNVRVKRVVCALDCGQVVNPDNVAA